MMCSGPFSGAQGHSNLQMRTDRRVRGSSEPCSSSPDKVWPDGVVPSCATPLPGSIAATDHGVAGLSVASETGTPVPSRRPKFCASLHAPRGCMWRATLAGSAGIQITQRTARTIWEHRPRWVSRDDVEPAEFTKRTQHHFPGRPHESGEPQGPTGPRGCPDLADQRLP